MSRKMIDYQVENGKIKSIDGYSVGGDELTGAAIMGVSKDSDTITRTLDVDGKVKFDTKGDKTTFEIKYDKERGISLSAKAYTLNELIMGAGPYEQYTDDKPIMYIPYYVNIDRIDSNRLVYLVEPEGSTGPQFQLTIGNSFRNYNASISVSCVCTRAGTLSSAHSIKYKIEYLKVAFNQ